MGWWTAQSDPEIVVGDDSYLHAARFLKRLSDLYQEDLGRKPTLAEVLFGLQEALLYNAHKLLKDCAELDVKEVTAKTAKRRKRQLFALGDYFAIPLRNGHYGFGRILLEHLGYLVAVFDITAETMKPPRELEKAEILFSVRVSPEGWEEWTWRVLGGHDDFDPSTVKQPSFCMGDDVTGWRISTGNSTRPATAEEVRGMERAQVWPPERIAWRIEAMKGIVTTKDVAEMLARGQSLHKAGSYEQASTEVGLAAQYAQWIVPSSNELSVLRDDALKILHDCLTRLGAPGYS
jgi:hypothetical protein